MCVVWGMIVEVCMRGCGSVLAIACPDIMYRPLLEIDSVLQTQTPGPMCWRSLLGVDAIWAFYPVHTLMF